MRAGRLALGVAAIAAASLTWAYATTAATQGKVPSDSPGYDDPEPAVRPAAGTPLAKGKDLFETKCNECHEYQDATQMRNSRAAWTALVGRMSANGLDATPDEKGLIINYLTAAYGPG